MFFLLSSDATIMQKDETSVSPKIPTSPSLLLYFTIQHLKVNDLSRYLLIISEKTIARTQHFSPMQNFFLRHNQNQINHLTIFLTIPSQSLIDFFELRIQSLFPLLRYRITWTKRSIMSGQGINRCIQGRKRYRP